MNKIFFILCFAFILIGCDKDDEVTVVDLKVDNIDLIPIGQVPLKEAFEAQMENGHVKCTLTTVSILKNDEIKSLTAQMAENQIWINIYACGNDFPADTEDFLFQEVKFDLLGVTPGTYKFHLNYGSYQNTYVVDLY